MNNSNPLLEDTKEIDSSHSMRHHYNSDEELLNQELRTLVLHRDKQLVTVLNDLHATLADLNATVQAQMKMKQSSNDNDIDIDTTDTDTDNGDSNGNDNDNDEAQDNAAGQLSVERATVRLDGLEVYAVVSALTSATLYQGFDAFTPHSWDDAHLIELLGDGIFFLSSSLGVVAGLHATLVFSLMTVYGRTAIGMARDDALGAFMTSTGMVRYRGFQSFLCSIYAFLIQVVCMITSKAPDKTRLLFFAGVMYSMYVVCHDTKAILASANVIFLPPVPVPVVPVSTTTTKKKPKTKKKQ
jgi:hypothetical protein